MSESIKVMFKTFAKYNSTTNRNKMLDDESWIKLVPKKVVEFIDKIDGVNRIRDLVKTDNP